MPITSSALEQRLSVRAARQMFSNYASPAIDIKTQLRRLGLAASSGSSIEIKESVDD